MIYEQLFSDWSHEQLSVAREVFYAYCYGADNSYWQNQLERAQAYQQVASELAQALQDQVLIQAAIYLRRLVCGDAKQAGVPAGELWASGEQPTPTDVVGLSLTYKAYFLVAAGQPDAAWRTMQQAGVTHEIVPAIGVHRKLVGYLQAYIARGVDLDAVTPVLADALAHTRKIGTRLHQLQILALAAWQQLQISGRAAARPALEQAAALAVETGYVRVLLDIRELVQLLEELRIAIGPAPQPGLQLGPLPDQHAAPPVGGGIALTAQ